MLYEIPVTSWRVEESQNLWQNIRKQGKEKDETQRLHLCHSFWITKWSTDELTSFSCVAVTSILNFHITTRIRYVAQTCKVNYQVITQMAQAMVQEVVEGLTNLPT